ncbi:MAG: ImuA family protein, partial [Janthinobacterium lividum]
MLWILGKHDLFSEGLAQAGLDPGRLILVQSRRDALQAMEEGLRHPDLAGVVCELEGRLDLVASRRLQLAAEATDVLGLVLRRSRRFNDPALVAPSAATSRWRISGVPSPPPLAHAPDVQGVGRPLWKLELLRCRGAEPATWVVEGCDAQGRLALASVLADRQAAPGPLRR